MSLLSAPEHKQHDASSEQVILSVSLLQAGLPPSRPPPISKQVSSAISAPKKPQDKAAYQADASGNQMGSQFPGGPQVWEGVGNKGFFSRDIPMQSAMAAIQAESLRPRFDEPEEIRKRAYDALYLALESMQALLASGQTFRCQWGGSAPGPVDVSNDVQCSGMDPSLLPGSLRASLQQISWQYERGLVMEIVDGAVRLSVF